VTEVAVACCARLSASSVTHESQLSTAHQQTQTFELQQLTHKLTDATGRSAEAMMNVSSQASIVLMLVLPCRIHRLGVRMVMCMTEEPFVRHSHIIDSASACEETIRNERKPTAT